MTGSKEQTASEELEREKKVEKEKERHKKESQQVLRSVRCSPGFSLDPSLPTARRDCLLIISGKKCMSPYNTALVTARLGMDLH